MATKRTHRKALPPQSQAPNAAAPLPAAPDVPDATAAAIRAAMLAPMPRVPIDIPAVGRAYLYQMNGTERLSFSTRLRELVSEWLAANRPPRDDDDEDDDVEDESLDGPDKAVAQARDSAESVPPAVRSDIFQGLLIARTLRDGSGVRIFTDADHVALIASAGGMAAAIVMRSLELNGFTADAAAAAKKK